MNKSNSASYDDVDTDEILSEKISEIIMGQIKEENASVTLGVLMNSLYKWSISNGDGR